MRGRVRGERERRGEEVRERGKVSGGELTEWEGGIWKEHWIKIRTILRRSLDTTKCAHQAYMYVCTYVCMHIWDREISLNTWHCWYGQS